MHCESIDIWWRYGWTYISRNSSAKALQEKYPDVQIVFVGTDSGLEVMVPKAGFKFRGMELQGFKRKLSLAILGRL